MSYTCDECGYEHVTEDKPERCIECGNTSFKKDGNLEVDTYESTTIESVLGFMTYFIHGPINAIQAANKNNRSLLILALILILAIVVIGLTQLLFFV